MTKVKWRPLKDEQPFVTERACHLMVGCKDGSVGVVHYFKMRAWKKRGVTHWAPMPEHPKKKIDGG